MTDRQWLEIQRESGEADKRTVTRHPDNPELGLVDGACPGCAAMPFVISASAPRQAPNKVDTLMGNGHAECCGDPVGYVYSHRQTIFGLEEDRAILDPSHGRARVYR